jgi:hypothetical protein
MDRLTADALRARLRAAIGEPEVTGQGFDLAAARARRRRWWALELGTAPAPVRAASMVALVVAVAAVVTVGTVIHLQGLPKPAGSSNGPAGVSQPNPAATIPLGPAVDGFVPEDVTAVSADQWWVLGSDSAGCSGADCTRILHTLDGGQTFTSIPIPPAVVTGLRFRDPEDGWAYSSTTMWSTHDGGAEWNATSFSGMTIDDLETSGGYVYAIACDSAPVCSLERSPATRDSWQALALPSDVSATRYLPGSLNVHGSDVWMAFSWRAANEAENVSEVLTSTDNGAHVSESSVCPGTNGLVSLYGVNAADLWATCATGNLVGVWRSVDGGQVFTEVQQSGGYGEPNTGTIAATSAANAVMAGTRLLFTTDGGQNFQVALDNGDGWSVVGFTNSEDGFAFSYPNSSYAQPNGLWRSDDAGAQWYEVQFP